MGGEGREGDWECGGCKNRNYAFRSFCNRCKQPRLLVDTKTPPDSKWLPRIGDWICTGCTNNNYASREKCKKCGQPKEVAAMPAVAIPGALPPYSHHVARGQGVPELRIPPTSNWPLGGHHSNGNPLAYPTNQLPSVPKGWRNGDWICSCGFHNYSSRAQCKKCNASQPPAIGMKRLASEDLVQEWDNKRLNAGHMEHNFLASGLQRSYQGFDPVIGNGGDPRAGIFAPYPNANQTVTPNPNMPGPLLQVPVQLPNPTPALLGKGAKQWRSGDWMCTNCSNHNYASRVQCNRCKTPREAGSQPVNAV